MITISYRSPRSQSQSTAGTTYTLTLVNESAQPWTFYVYQEEPNQSSALFSLAWFASPYKIRVGNSIRFQWEIDYNFVWSDTGPLKPGVTFEAGGPQPAHLVDKNTTTFSLNPGPGLSPPVQGPPAGSLVIQDASDVPNNKFSVGIGMSGVGTYAEQAGTNLKHYFTPTPSYWVVAGTEVQIGTVLNIQTITKKAQAVFGSSVYSVIGTLDDTNSWRFVDG